ncbi:MAG: post-COAP-1 domain-containing protein [Terriglobales bacterium]
MTRKNHFRLGLAVAAALVLGSAAPRLAAQTQIVLGDSAQEFQLVSHGNAALQLQFASCPAAQCVLSGSAYGEGSFASSNGAYALLSSANNAIVLTVTSDDSGSSFTVTQSQPLQFRYSSPEGDLSGTLTFTSLEQGNGSTSGDLSGELQLTGGSLASSLSSNLGSVSLLVPLGAQLAQIAANGGSATGQIGYPSTITLAPSSTGTCPVCRDFVTGGGWITASDGAKANFGVHGGVRNGGYWGHLEFNDHGSQPPMMVKSTSITNYLVLSPSTREMDGTASVNGQAGYTFQVIVSDNDQGGEGPGPNHADTFSLRVSNGYTASGNLGGGDIEIHRGKCGSQLHQRSQSCQKEHWRGCNR